MLKAGADLSRMLAASQLGITICSLLLGRLGEPAVAHLIERPFSWLGLPDEVLGPVAFTISLVVVVVAHMVLGEMVPKNIAIAGPERTAIWLVPPFLAFTTVMSPVISLFKITAAGVLRLMGVQPRDELDTAITSGQLADLIAESGREGLLDDDGSRRLTRTLLLGGPHRRRRAGDAASSWCRCRSGRSSTTSRGPSPTPASPGSRCAPTAGFSGYLHVKDILDIADDPGAEVPSQRIRRLPQVRVTDRLDVALAVLRRAGRAPRARGRRRAAPRPGSSRWRTSSSTTSAPSATPPTPARSPPDPSAGAGTAYRRRVERAAGERSGGARAAAHRDARAPLDRPAPRAQAARRGAPGARLPVHLLLATGPPGWSSGTPGPGVVLRGGRGVLGRPGYVRARRRRSASTRPRSRPASRRPPGSSAPCSPPRRPGRPG